MFWKGLGDQTVDPFELAGTFWILADETDGDDDDDWLRQTLGGRSTPASRRAPCHCWCVGSGGVR